MSEAWLILETSGRSRVGVAVGERVVATAELGPGRQHNRELVPTIERLAVDVGGLTALAGIAVGIGPGSYTGLRIGLTAAKTLAYALDCPLVAVPSFATIAAEVALVWSARSASGTSVEHGSLAERAEHEPLAGRAEHGPLAGRADHVDVIADALQGTIYLQRFCPQSVGELHIVRFDDWLASSSAVVAGPGVETFADKLVGRVCSTSIHPSIEAVNRVRRTLAPLSREDMMRLEPLYLRGSSAEEKAKAKS